MHATFLQSRDPEAPRRLVTMAAISVLAHLAIVPLLTRSWVSELGTGALLPPLPSLLPVSLLVDPQSPDTPADPEAIGQFVSLPAPDADQRPDEARYRDQYDRVAEVETVSPRDRGDASRPADAAPESPGQPGSASSPNRRSRSLSTDARPLRSEPDAPVPSESDGPSVTLAPDPQAQGTGTEGLTQPFGDEPGFDLRAFNPRPGTFPRLDPSRAPIDDYLELPEGDVTQINSIRSRYWSFFDRMHQQLAREWDPEEPLLLQDPGGRLYGTSDRHTVVDVVLNGDGSLREARVSSSCGLRFLDEEAIRALRAAQPFPNVPEGLKNEEGLATMTWGFHVLYENRRGGLRLMRWN